MKIVVATPLYPPDIAGAALYAKEFAARFLLASNSVELSLVTYTYMPEPVSGVRIVSVNKRLPLPLRLIAYAYVLWNETRGADVLYVQNGASVELPASIVSLIRPARLVFHVSDAAAHEHAASSRSYGVLERFIRTRAHQVITDTPPTRPEILPFVPYPAEAIADYESSWSAHLKTLQDAFTHA